MRCMICDCENPDYAVVCERCGSFLPKMSIEPEKDPDGQESILDPTGTKEIRCSYCWHINPAEAELCEVCGMPLLYVPYPENEGRYADVPTRAHPKPKAGPVPPGMVRCRNCWGDNPEEAIKCEFCGKLLKGKDDAQYVDYEYIRRLRDSTISCVECGTVVPWSTLTCPNCGANPRVGYPQGKPDYTDTAIRRGLAEAADALRKAVSLENSEAIRRKAEEAERIRRSQNKSKINHSVPGKKRCRYCWYDNPMTAEACVQCGKSFPGAKLNKGNPKQPQPDVPKVEKRKPCTCGYVNLPYVTVCMKCGGEVRPRCPECGYQNPRGMRHCVKCFTPLQRPRKS